MGNNSLTPIRAIETFIRCKKEGTQVPFLVWDTIKTYQKWNQIELTGLINASVYYPELLFEPGMEERIAKRMDDFKKRIVEIPIQ
ncbi:hypothetical protein CH373_13140 [Leptospira perolatii]|uniref:Uncharacterized protein n=1 Tax=Leptospira perolatii TaxID=2023191 RepID=A0A2M9ZKS1_9LEPT|nr:hypothetical protein [Leptospira perolatii]PJZ69944.1 hypothetical protein CH360_08545 [Leptospira perolatii]PJZ72648.1 hypothetical protein CH373_13140 [Leptospira perolatii]